MFKNKNFIKRPTLNPKATQKEKINYCLDLVIYHSKTKEFLRVDRVPHVF